MADIDLKTETPDTSLPSTGFLFGADSQSAASPSVYSTQAVATALLGSTSLTGATVTADSPVLNLAQTWNNVAVTFTGLKFNVPTDSSASGSLLMDLQVGGTSKFKVDKAGSTTFADILNGASSLSVGARLFVGCDASTQQLIGLNNGMTLRWGSGSAVAGSSTYDLILSRRAAANLRLGAADTSASATITVTIAAPGVVTWSGHSLSTGSPVIFTTTGALPTGITAGTTYYAIVVDANTFQLASSFTNALAGTAITTSGSQSGTHTGRRGAIAQTFGVQDTLSTSSLENIDGADLVIRGSRSIGNKPGGSIVFQVAPAGSSGTAQNALVTFLEATSARAFNLYNTTDVTTNYERGKIAWSSNVLQIGTEKAGTGTARALEFQTDGTTRLTIATSGDATFSNNVNISSAKLGGTQSNQFAFDIRLTNSSFVNFARLRVNAQDKLIFYNGAGDGAPLMQIGGETSSFPALKRNSTALETKLADDSAYAPHAMQYLDVTDGITAPASATGRARIYVDTADGDLKVIFADGTVKTIVTDT